MPVPPDSDTPTDDIAGSSSAEQTNDVLSSGTQDDASTSDKPESLLEAVARDVGVDLTEDDLDLSVENPSVESAEEQGESSEEVDGGDASDPKEAKDETEEKNADAGNSDTEVSADDKPDVDEAGFTAEEKKQLSAKTNERIRSLVQRAKAAESKVEAAEVEAGKFRQITDFMSKNQLTGDDANLTFGIMAAAKQGDYKTFLDLVMPYVETARAHLGEHVPDDLRGQIDDGFITEEAARETAKLRAQKKDADERLARQTQQFEQSQAEQRSNAIHQAVSTWKQTASLSDPDFARKEELVTGLVVSRMQREGSPTSPEIAVQWAKEAYQQVGSLVKSETPSAPTRPTPSATPTRNAQPKAPGSLMEAAMRGLQAAQN